MSNSSPGSWLLCGYDGDNYVYDQASPDCRPTVYCFTGKERDAETGLDYFGARYMSAAQGRFTSPDAPLVDQNPADPQSWNLYSYGRNNPLRFIDPTGNEAVSASDCEKNPSCTVVQMNVIYDRNAALFDKKGNVLPSVQQRVADQINEAGNEYGDILVAFDVRYSTGPNSDLGKER